MLLGKPHDSPLRFIELPLLILRELGEKCCGNQSCHDARRDSRD